MSISQLARKHRKARETVRRRLVNVPFTAGPKGARLYDAELAATAIEAVDIERGDLLMERLKKTKAERELLEMELAKERNEYIHRERLSSLLQNIFVAIKMKILGSHLSEAEQDAILTDLAGLKDADL